MRPSDGELLRASREGDMDAFGVFYTRYREALLGHLVRRLRKPELAADLLAEAFARALIVVKDDDAELPHAPAAWLFAVAMNLVRDSARSKHVEMTARARLGLERLVLDDGDIERILEIGAANDLLSGVRAHLSDVEWEALYARFVDEQPYALIAEQLQCSQAVVRKRVSRARAHLRTAFGGPNA
ncbi:MAG: RNA polymerase sigma factor [Solirubrobacteraceae bacterium]